MNNKNSSGQKPADIPCPLRPTVIGTSGGGHGKMKPTVIGEGKVEEKKLKPTVMTAPVEVPAPPQKVVPSVLPQKVFHTAPKVIGIQRKRIPITLRLLQDANPLTKVEVLEEAIRIVHGIDVDTLEAKQIIFMGSDLQEKYSSLVSRKLELIQSEDVSRVTGYMNRIVEILEQVDMRKICGFGSVDSFFTFFSKKNAKEIDTMPELEDAQSELEQIVQFSRERVDGLLTLHSELEEVSSRTLKLGYEVESFATAMMYIAEYLEGHAQSDLVRRFEDRHESLMRTLVDIRSSVSTDAVHRERPLQLINAINDIVLVTLPRWLGSIVSLRGLAEAGRRATVTEANELHDQKQDIVLRLKGK